MTRIDIKLNFFRLVNIIIITSSDRTVEKYDLMYVLHVGPCKIIQVYKSIQQGGRGEAGGGDFRKGSPRGKNKNLHSFFYLNIKLLQNTTEPNLSLELIESFASFKYTSAYTTIKNWSVFYISM